MTWFEQLLVLAVLMAGAMSVAWAWQRRHRNAGIVDAVWAAGVGGGALLAALTGVGTAGTRVLLALLAGIWSARLAWHIWRRVRAEEEDGRYRALRAHWNGHQGKFYGFFLFQAGLVVLFALPFVAVAANTAPLSPARAVLALVVWLAAVAGETLADRQLAAWRANPANRGKTCRAGLWRYSRHPNYFFEWCHWFAYVVLAWGSPLFWLSLGGPVIMYVFLRWVSGIPFTEKQALRTRGDDYRAYQRDTAMFFPWFPKSHSTHRQDRS